MAHRNHSGIQNAFGRFQGLIEIAEEFLRKQRYVEATTSAQIAALYASYNHTGEFVSPRLEDVLRAIGSRTAGGPAAMRMRAPGERQRILHVLTAAKDVGGDSRFVWRWIQRDRERRHSVALTCQMYFEVPPPLTSAVADRGGQIHVLDRGGLNAIERARELRRVAQDADLVFLHVYVEDVVPVMAFANKVGLPPIIFVVQADHQFWTGVSIADSVVHLRDSGLWLSARRRRIPKALLAPSLPIPMEKAQPSASKAEAKQKLGLAPDSVVLLTIARAIKYKPIGTETGFVDAMVPIVNRHPNVVLLAVGPADADEWKAAQQKTGGRMRALGQRSDTRQFYEAADVYLDSFPFASNTSLLEAGSFGLPLVSYFPYSNESEVLGPGAPGMDGSLVRARTLREYESHLAKLIGEAAFREETGRRTRADITFMHIGEGWNQALETMYGSLPLTSQPPAGSRADETQSGELDVLLNRYYSRHVPLGWIIGWYARHLPYGSRLRVLIKMLRVNRAFSFAMFLPDSVMARIGSYLKGWRQLPVLGRWASAKG